MELYLQLYIYGRADYKFLLSCEHFQLLQFPDIQFLIFNFKIKT